MLTVMPANATNELVHLWAGQFPGRIGHLYTPERKERLRPWIPYALDNGRYSDIINNREFDPVRFVCHVERYVYLAHKPMWIVVPDVPFNGPESLVWWDEWEDSLRQYGIPLALAVQNGMDRDVLKRLRPGDWVFVGGDTVWKWDTAVAWASWWRNVHVGRVNSPARLYDLEKWGVKSCDGSGWFRGKSPQVVGLAKYLAESSGADPDYASRCALSTRFHSNYSDQNVLDLEAVA